ncbi:MAG: serine protease [Chloroflexi bacterium]|nr:MAG: serine protease [Chloroflexota bacterium]
MQDSSLNPYIPQESATNHAKTTRLQSPLGKLVKILLIVTITVAILIAASLFFIVPRTSYDDKDARVALGNVLQPSDQITKLTPIESTAGFALSYENQQFTSYGKVGAASSNTDEEEGSGEYYENNELRTTRNYNYVRVTPLQSADASRSFVTQPPQLVISSTVTNDTLKANEAKPEYKELSKQSLFIQLDTEDRLAKKTLDDGTIVTVEATKPSARTINGVQYQKVRFTTKNDNNRIANERYDDCYYVIQNEQPYSACINNIRPNNLAAAALAQSVLESVSYKQPAVPSAKEDSAADKAASATSQFPTIRLAQATEKDATSSDASDQQKELGFVTPKPEYNDNGLSLKSIAKNQPSVVRVGTLYCADLALKYGSGETATTLTDACVGNVASGAVVSSDGYIATTGHAIRYNAKDAINGYINFADTATDMRERLNRVLDYLLKSNFLFQTDADYLRIGAQTGDQEALAKIENIGSLIPDNYITPVKEEYTYAIQPSDQPIVVNKNDANKPAFAYSDTVIPAKYVVSDYDTKKAEQVTFGSDVPSKDVGLVKVEGSFQNVAIAAGDDIKSKDILNVLGYPGYTDRGLSIDKIRNAPINTLAIVDQTYDKGGQKVIQVANPILPGNDGAPAFRQDGKLVGFGVYGLAYCPDQDCFSKGTVRSSNELIAMADKQNIQFGGLSEVSTIWSQGVDEYFKGNYAAASSKFAQAGNGYRFNQFAKAAVELADSKKGSQSDTSLFNQLLGVLIGVLVFLVVATVVLAIVYTLHRKRLDSLAVGHYGASVPGVTVPQPVMQPAAPMAQPQQYAYNQPPAPQQYQPQPQVEQWQQQQSPQPVMQQPYQQPTGIPQAQPYQPVPQPQQQYYDQNGQVQPPQNPYAPQQPPQQTPPNNQWPQQW